MSESTVLDHPVGATVVRGVDLDALAAFVSVLREASVPIPADALGLFAEATAVVGDEPAGLYWAGRTTLLSKRDDIGTYDDMFRVFWSTGAEVQPPGDTTGAIQVPPPVEVHDTDDDAHADEGEHGDHPDDTDPDEAWVVRASRRETLRARDFASYTPEELIAARSFMCEMRVSADLRPSRRTRATTRRRGRLDLRRTVAAAQGTGGEIIRLRRTRRVAAPRRLVFLLDISGSMAAYSRALLQFSQVAASARADVEVFTMGTRLTRLTRQLRGHDPDAALARAASAVPDWAGGTRLGQSLRQFNDEWGIRGTARGAVVVVVSDGWERDDPQPLADELARLGRVAHRVVWVNPLKASKGYEPVARGMAAALPYVDAFVAGHNLDTLPQVARAIRGTVDGTCR